MPVTPDNDAPVVAIEPIGYAPSGGETQVNTTTLNLQYRPAIAGLTGAGSRPDLLDVPFRSPVAPA